MVSETPFRESTALSGLENERGPGTRNVSFRPQDMLGSLHPHSIAKTTGDQRS